MRQKNRLKGKRSTKKLTRKIDDEHFQRLQLDLRLSCSGTIFTKKLFSLNYRCFGKFYFVDLLKAFSYKTMKSTGIHAHCRFCFLIAISFFNKIRPFSRKSKTLKCPNHFG